MEKLKQLEQGLAFDSDSGESDASDGESKDVDEKSHARLLDAISTMDGSKRLTHTLRGVHGQSMSESGLVPQDVQADTLMSDLMSSLQKSASHGVIKKQLKSTLTTGGVVETPAPKHIKEKSQRSAGYEKTVKEVSRWDSVVNANRKAPQLKFPLEQPTTKLLNIQTQYRPVTDLEKAMKAELAKINPDHKIAKGKVFTPAEERQMAAMSLEEAKERRAELLRMRAIMYTKNSKLRWQNKIKSKRYRRALKKEKEKKAEKALEELAITDPQALVDKLEESDRQRILERGRLRHAGGKKFAVQAKIFSKYDTEKRQQIQNMLEKHKSLKKKKEVVMSSSESEDEEGGGNSNLWVQPTTTTTTTARPPPVATAPAPVLSTQPMQLLKEEGGPAETELEIVEEKEVVTSSSESEEEEEEEEDSTQQQPRTEGAPAETEVENGPKEKDVSTTLQAKDNNNSNNNTVKPKKTAPAAVRRKQETSLPQQGKKKTKRPATASAPGNSTQQQQQLTKEGINADADIDSMNQFPEDGSSLGQKKGDRRGDADKIQEVLMTIQDAFDDDDVVADFVQEKQEIAEEEKEKDVDTFLPGWGSWAGAGIKVAPKLRQRFIVKAPPQQRQDDGIGNVVILKKENKLIEKHKVEKVPHTFKSVGHMKKVLSTPLAKDKNNIKPKTVVSRIGQIIQPLQETVLLHQGQKRKAAVDIDLSGKRSRGKKRRKH
ncbi:U3 small nucleolar RNA-associated protein 14 homolog A-like isoform X2 [Babylonia areolata]|uniref:U3 small nucleolar RNA-associated protein 14 homolog A-like isoform X2 n=1 Tax=Babylonia areolata TaxID=304850 RepID=UPI003FD632A2